MAGTQKLLGPTTTSRKWAQEARVGSLYEMQDAFGDCLVSIVLIGNQRARSGGGMEGRELTHDSHVF